MAIEYATVYARIFGVLSPAGDGGGGSTAEVLVDSRYTSGTTANKADKIYHDIRTLALSTNEDLDLTTLEDENGVALALADITCMVIEMDSDNGDEFQVAPGAANGFDLIWDGTSPILHCPAGSTIMFFAPADPAWVVDGTHKVINFANQDGAAAGTYTLTIFGRSA